MSISTLWSQYGESITSRPGVSLAAFLGDEAAWESLVEDGLPVPEYDVFRQEQGLDPNPYGLDLPQEMLENQFLVRCLAFWGWQPLLLSAVASARLQVEQRPECPEPLSPLRAEALAAATAYLAAPDSENEERARLAARACYDTYGPFEEDPDSKQATQIWEELGAPWFAAESAAQDVALHDWDAKGPEGASSTWGNRCSVWPQRAAEGAAVFASHAAVREAIVTATMEWCRGRG
ncbi:hypothetical protein Mal4_56620 [Maioricimonas rarisocia]|uniref:Uncharacterized protein n=1 Tax=Maioricimonas rarisocia TaxID=2528026 RepID=A0A517ZFP8_9PLAN|nr:hypothetical protein [Maioricimonas rarisocia]QDU41296.1 hypothetical protein Mal4_56620 [Maioricimonas rarisocia]